MTIAVARAILESKDSNELRQNSIKHMQEVGRKYPDAGYGFQFRTWLVKENPEGYDSWGNGAAMRV